MYVCYKKSFLIRMTSTPLQPNERLFPSEDKTSFQTDEYTSQLNDQTDNITLYQPDDDSITLLKKSSFIPKEDKSFTSIRLWLKSLSISLPLFVLEDFSRTTCTHIFSKVTIF